MQSNSEIIANFRNFIQTNDRIENSQQILKSYRNIKIGDYNLKDSRCIWMSLMLYKFKQEMDVSEELWSRSRQLVISMLRSDPDLKHITTSYLKEFEIWQKEDLVNLVTQIGGNYYNLIQIKNSIENTGNEETIQHWAPHYKNLIQRIRSYSKSVGILEKVDDFVLEFEQQKYNIVKEIMDKAYWDRVESDMDATNLDIVYSNLSELKSLLLDIIPKSINTTYLNEYFDIDYIKHIVTNGVLDKEYLTKLFIFVIGILKEWDSAAFLEKYDEELNQIDTITGSLNHIIRCILQKLMVMTIDLKNRKALWNIILKK
jgi:hypothetical protein